MFVKNLSDLRISNSVLEDLAIQDRNSKIWHGGEITLSTVKAQDETLILIVSPFRKKSGETYYTAELSDQSLCKPFGARFKSVEEVLECVKQLEGKSKQEIDKISDELIDKFDGGAPQPGEE